MTPPPRTPLRDVLSTHRDLWDHDDVRPSVREAFAKVTACRTPALGAEVFASAQGGAHGLPHVQVPSLPELRRPGHPPMAARDVADAA